MPILRRRRLERYLRLRLGPKVELLTFGPIGEESSVSGLKRYGYGTPIRLTYRVGRATRRAVLGTMRPGPFGHEHMADRAQALLWDFDSYGRLPRHVEALDVGAFAGDGSLFSVSRAREFFLLTEWAEGETYHLDLERLARTGRLLPVDRQRARALARYLARIHRRKRRDRDLYRRRLRELIGHGECIMGLTDSYPAGSAGAGEAWLRSIEEACNRWRWRLRGLSGRLSQVHGDFHPWNVLFRKGTDFTVLDRSRGEWGEPADDVTAMTINYLFFSLRRWGRLRGPFEILFGEFWRHYLAGSEDRGVMETAAPFFAYRGLVLASPLWYPDLTVTVRRKIQAFVQNVLAEERFVPEDVNRYCEV
jgi:hypothetical protein